MRLNASASTPHVADATTGFDAVACGVCGARGQAVQRGASGVLEGALQSATAATLLTTHDRAQVKELLLRAAAGLSGFGDAASGAAAPSKLQAHSTLAAVWSACMTAVILYFVASCVEQVARHRAATQRTRAA